MLNYTRALLYMLWHQSSGSYIMEFMCEISIRIIPEMFNVRWMHAARYYREDVLYSDTSIRSVNSSGYIMRKFRLQTFPSYLLRYPMALTIYTYILEVDSPTLSERLPMAVLEVFIFPCIIDCMYIPNSRCNKYVYIVFQ